MLLAEATLRARITNDRRRSGNADAQVSTVFALPWRRNSGTQRYRIKGPELHCDILRR